MTQEQKAKAFDLIYQQKVTGMSWFWDNYDELRLLPHQDILASMGKFAAKEAIEVLLELETVPE